MSRDWKHLELSLDKLAGDIYPQPPDEGHTAMANALLRKWLPGVSHDTYHPFLLDVGCGQGFCKPIVESLEWRWHGCTLGEDWMKCKEQGLPVDQADFSFLPYEDGSYDLILARHVLEHSPMPLLTLMEWHRVAKSYLMLAAPNPDCYGYCGRNHYYVLNEQQLTCLLQTAGWKVLWKDLSEFSEIRMLCGKG